jgi:hypothetical protein
MTEQPYPTIKQILDSSPPKLKQHHRTLESMLDDHEQGCQTGSSLPVANTFHSKYKSKHTLKLFGACTPSGFALSLDTIGRPLDEAEPRPGSCNDAVMVEMVKFAERVSPGYCSMADKGILVHSLFAASGHTLLTPFKKRRNIQGMSETAMTATEGTARVRIHIERMFERVQDFKVMKKIFKVTDIDIFSSIWSVCYQLINFDSELIRHDVE